MSIFLRYKDTKNIRNYQIICHIFFAKTLFKVSLYVTNNKILLYICLQYLFICNISQLLYVKHLYISKNFSNFVAVWDLSLSTGPRNR